MNEILGTAAIGASLLLALAMATSKALVSDGKGLDRAIAALWFGAKRGEMVSLIVAQWQADRTGPHYKAGCRWCWFLAWAVQPNHCALQLDPNAPATPVLDAARAGVLLLLLSAVLWTVPLLGWIACGKLWALVA